MKNYISFFQYGGPINNNINFPSADKAKNIIKNTGKFLLGPLMFTSCSGDYCNTPTNQGIKELDDIINQKPVSGSTIRHYYLDEFTLPIERRDRMYDKKTNTYKNDTTYDQSGQRIIHYAPGTFYEGKDNNVKGTVISPQTSWFGNIFAKRNPQVSLYYNNNELGPDSIKTVYFNLNTNHDAEKLGIDPYLWDAPSGTQKKKDVSKNMTHSQFINTFIR